VPPTRAFTEYEGQDFERSIERSVLASQTNRERHWMTGSPAIRVGSPIAKSSSPCASMNSSLAGAATISFRSTSGWVLWNCFSASVSPASAVSSLTPKRAGPEADSSRSRPSTSSLRAIARSVCASNNSPWLVSVTPPGSDRRACDRRSFPGAESVGLRPAESSPLLLQSAPYSHAAPQPETCAGV
jgi:hypothetical protein